MKIFITGALDIFLILHGLVHLLYFAQSWRLFELRPNLVWPSEAWALPHFLGDDRMRRLAGIALVLAAAGFVAGALGLFIQQAWWRPVVVSSAALSTLIYILCWDATFQKLADQGAIGILINVAIAVAVLTLGHGGLSL
jgi:CHASE2 domain-containing sensor protein